MDEVRWLDDEEQQAWRLLLRVTLTLVDRLDEQLRRHHQISLGDYEILAHLSGAPDEGLRMRDLAARALVSRSRLTHTVDRLVTRGYVCRKACEHDRRGVVAVLTAEGRALLEAAAPTHVEDVRSLLVDQLPRGGARSLLRTLQPVLDRLTDEAG